MQRKIVNFIKKDYVIAGLWCFAIAFMSFIYFIIRGHGFFVLTNDFNDQQIPFTIGLHNALLDGGLSGFSWDIDLGTSSLDGFSFYELGSPFFWLSMLFPANAFPFIVAWFFMLKFTAAGVISCLYIREYVEDKKWAIFGAVLYAYSGFSIANMLFYHFHDVIAFFPLLLIGLERMMDKKKYNLFIFSVFLNCIINYYFFVGEVIFLILYYLCKYMQGSYKVFLCGILKCIACGIIGVGMSAFVFIPSVLFIMDNPRTSGFTGLFNMLFLDKNTYLYILKTMFLPAEPLTSISAIYNSNFASYGFYIPLIGFSLCFAYVIKNKKDWLTIIVLVCFIGSFVPLFSEMFSLYSSGQMRWWYAFTLMTVLASVRFLDNIDKKALAWGILLNLVLIIGAALLIWSSQLVFISKRFLVITCVAILGIVLTWLILKYLKKTWLVLQVLVSLLSATLLFVTIHIYRDSSWMDYEGYRLRYEVAKDLNIPDDQYRFNDTMNLISMMAHVAGFTNQTSTDTNSIRDFEAIFGFYDPVSAIPKNDIPGLAELLGGRYFLAFNDYAGEYIQKFETEYGTMYLLEKPACPIGFSVDSYITKNDLMKLPVEDRAIALLDSVVLDDDVKKSEIVNSLTCTTDSDIDFGKSVIDYVNEHISGAVQDFNLDGNGMYCNCSYDKETYVYFSVPYDKGWTATVDNKETEIIETGGMMLIKVPAGIHSIKFSYYTPGLKIGVAVSVVSAVIYIGILLVSVNRNKFERTKDV